MDARRLGPCRDLIVFLLLATIAVTNPVHAQFGGSVPMGTLLVPSQGPGPSIPVVRGMPTAPFASPSAPRPTAVRATSTGAGQSPNFIVLCSDPQLTQAVSEAAERLRRELAVHWLGHELPNWSQRIPLRVTSGPTLGAGGETVFTLYNGNVGNWSMSVQGTPERILDSVLPHEITHTIFASHFAPLNTHVPRWADEGACTTVEDDSEQSKHRKFLVQFLRSGRGLAFNRMFSLKDYPQDMLPLYAQGHAVAEFLIAQGGPRKFVTFLEDGMKSQQWNSAIERAYGYTSLGDLQTKWNHWIADGRGAIDAYVAKPSSSASPSASLAVNQAQGGRVDLVSDSLAGRNNESQLAALSQQPVASEEVAEGVSLSLTALSGAAVTAASSVTSPQSQPNEVNLVARDAHPPTINLASESSTANGFFRQRLENNLRDIVRVDYPLVAAGNQSTQPGDHDSTPLQSPSTAPRMLADNPTNTPLYR